MFQDKNIKIQHFTFYQKIRHDNYVNDKIEIIHKFI